MRWDEVSGVRGEWLPSLTYSPRPWPWDSLLASWLMWKCVSIIRVDEAAWQAVPTHAKFRGLTMALQRQHATPESLQQLLRVGFHRDQIAVTESRIFSLVDSLHSWTKSSTLPLHRSRHTHCSHLGCFTIPNIRPVFDSLYFAGK